MMKSLGSTKNFIVIIAVIFISLLVMVSVFIAGFAVANVFGSFKLGSKTVYSTSAVLERVQAISELNTVEMYFNEIIDYSNAKYFKQFKIPFTTKKVLLTAKARVKAGVDLSKLTDDDIEVMKDSIKITLPKPTITSKEILESSVYDEQDGVLNEVTTEDTLKLVEEFTNQLGQQATESGIIEKAEENTKLAVENLLQLMGFEEIVVTFVD